MLRRNKGLLASAGDSYEQADGGKRCDGRRPIEAQKREVDSNHGDCVKEPQPEDQGWDEQKCRSCRSDLPLYSSALTTSQPERGSDEHELAGCDEHDCGRAESRGDEADCSRVMRFCQDNACVWPAAQESR